ncbi:Cytochrome P450 714C2 [Camellia lanceoleosa]|uniref:Cytochrome P450 714C2 n=1 Tax=Camellia lanceoleosa TaxID=1840588 RepID=A0ACC0H7A0_9ERIC|nr:Cytochrome P450 714C2 [Camellia lanceoleosa]
MAFMKNVRHRLGQFVDIVQYFVPFKTSETLNLTELKLSLSLDFKQTRSISNTLDRFQNLLQILKISLNRLLLFVAQLRSILGEASEALIKASCQGLRGPSPSFLLGNIPDFIKFQPKDIKALTEDGEATHDWARFTFPLFDHWTKQYGQRYNFALGTYQVVYITDPHLAKEISLSISLKLGKPFFLQKNSETLLGKGILTSDGEFWAHQRKTIAPEFYADKVKNLVHVMLDSTNKLINTWEIEIEKQSGTANINVDEDLQSFASIHLERAMKTPILVSGIPGLWYISTKSNLEKWRLKKEIHSQIMSIVNEHSSNVDVLHTIINGAKMSALGPAAVEQLIVDNLNTTAWTLMVLAMHPEWQDRAHAEVAEVCGESLPNATMLGKMKVGLDPSKFNPDRFANGIGSACKIPQVYIPFGNGPHICAGQLFAMLEIKVVLTIILSKFSFSLDANYVRSLVMENIIRPGHGINLIMQKLTT